MRHYPERDEYDTFEDYEDALDDYYAWEDYQFDQHRDDLLTGDA